jgi:hypothetical protein
VAAGAALGAGDGAGDGSRVNAAVSTRAVRRLTELHGHVTPHCEAGDKVPQLHERQLAIRMLKQQPIGLGIYHQDGPVP